MDVLVSLWLCKYPTLLRTVHTDLFMNVQVIIQLFMIGSIKLLCLKQPLTVEKKGP